MDTKHVENAFHLARQQYADIGVDVHEAIETLSGTSVSIHCWQGDDVGGFEKPGAELSGGGIQTTGNYPGKARTVEELRQDLRQALSLIPGTGRLNLHACYLENKGRFVDRNEIGVEHFQGWIDWIVAPGWGWISIRLSSRIQKLPTGLPWPTATRASGGSGLNTELPPEKSQPRWVVN